MSKKNTKIAALAARMRRVERKCDRIIAEMSSLRKALAPQPSEIDEIIGHLHRTATALCEQSRNERRHYSRTAPKE